MRTPWPLLLCGMLILLGGPFDSAGAQALCTPMGATLECTELGGYSAHAGDRYTIPIDRYDYSGSGAVVVPDGATGAGREVGSGLRAVPGPSRDDDREDWSSPSHRRDSHRHPTDPFDTWTYDR